MTWVQTPRQRVVTDTFVWLSLCLGMYSLDVSSALLSAFGWFGLFVDVLAFAVVGGIGGGTLMSNVFHAINQKERR
jgi:hypothetical protein